MCFDTPRMRPPATSDTYENRPDALLQRIRAILQRNLRYQHVRPLPSARRTGCATARWNAIARPYVIARKYVIARNFPSGDDRRIGDQIIRTVVSRGILPFQHGDRRSVVHTETALRLERQRGLAGFAAPGEADGRVVIGGVRERAVERVELVAELRERVQGLNDRTLEVLVDFRGGIVMAVDVAAVVRRHSRPAERPAGRTARRGLRCNAGRCIRAPNNRCC